MITRILRPRFLDVILVLAIAALAGYLLAHSRLAPDSAWGSLWPNITTDLFGIWLTVRVIDELGTVRSKRQEIMRGFRGNVNYSKKCAMDLLPQPRHWAMRSLDDEISGLTTRLDHQGMYLRQDERDRIRTAIRNLSAISLDAKELASIFRERTRLEDTMRRVFREATDEDRDHPYPHDVDELEALGSEYQYYADDPDIDSAKLVLAIEALRRTLPTLAISDPAQRAVTELADATEVAVERRRKLEQQVDQYAKFVRDTEVQFLDRVRE
ncbi:hypothetical protein ABJI51_05300 [Amycolatopsis sp. NEAU-NG30]|uniref:Uncharacterized protein n=1 Tax=Amycolatopsis melonis TaxID=3156488 RepID=A0ABV0L824_9PSEU